MSLYPQLGKRILYLKNFLISDIILTLQSV